jgi:hypothetical protein
MKYSLLVIFILIIGCTQNRQQSLMNNYKKVKINVPLKPETTIGSNNHSKFNIPSRLIENFELYLASKIHPELGTGIMEKSKYEELQNNYLNVFGRSYISSSEKIQNSVFKKFSNSMNAKSYILSVQQAINSYPNGPPYTYDYNIFLLKQI